nr:unnamed protein product [Callosobruchus chinensis]
MPAIANLPEMWYQQVEATAHTSPATRHSYGRLKEDIRDEIQRLAAEILTAVMEHAVKRAQHDCEQTISRLFAGHFIHMLQETPYITL